MTVPHVAACQRCGDERPTLIRVVGPDDRPGRNLCLECLTREMEHLR